MIVQRRDALLPGNEVEMMNTHAATCPAQVQQVLDDLEAAVTSSLSPLRDLRRDDRSPELGGIEPPD